jgi:hypothetical protein
MCASVGIAMPNQRDPRMRRTTITVGDALHAWCLAEAKRRGINDFSTFVRIVLTKEKHSEERKNEKKG